MGKLTDLIGRVLGGGAERRGMSAELAMALMGGYGSDSGVNVTPLSALRSSAVFSCVRVLSETVAMLPGEVYRRRGRDRDLATDHRLWSIIHSLANPEMTAFQWRELAMHHLLLYGNHFSEIEMTNRGDVVALWPLDPRQMEVRRTSGGDLYYHYTLPNNSRRDFLPFQILHIAGPSPDGVVGYSPIALARHAIGLGIATEAYGGKFFSNGARPGVVLEHPGTLKQDAYERLKESWNAAHQGLDNAQRVAILEQGLTMKTIGIPPDDAQFLETRQFQVVDISRFFRVPLHKINDLSRATFSNIEQQEQQFLNDSLGPWLVRIEQAMARDLIGPIERGSVFVEFKTAGLLRGDLVARYNAYATGRQWGWLSVNEIRRLENLNGVPEGDRYLEPLNMKIAGAPDPQPAPLADPGQAVVRALVPVVADAVDRVRRRAAQDTEAQRVKLNDDRFAEWHAQYRVGELLQFAKRALGPAASAVGADAGAWANVVVDAICGGGDVQVTEMLLDRV